MALDPVSSSNAWCPRYPAAAPVASWSTSTEQPVVLRTQTANARAMRVAAKLGFSEVERYEEYGAEQWLGARTPAIPPG